MDDFESKEFRSYVLSKKDSQALEFDVELNIGSVQLAEVELDKELLLAVHRC